jgi:lipoprotein-releasing system permease protein
MKFKLLSGIATSLLWARWKQTLVAAIGVTFSISMFIALLGFMTGLNDLLDGLVLNRTPHIRLYNEIRANQHQPIANSSRYAGYHHFISSIKPANSRDEIHNSIAVLRRLENDERILGTAPKITAQVFFHDGVIDITGVVNGIEVAEENRLFHFSDYVISGEANDLAKISNSIILGKALAEKLLVNIGDVVHVTTATGTSFPLKVVGYFQSGIQEFDKVQSYTSIKTVQKLLGKTQNYVTEIQVKLKDIRLAPAMAREFTGLFECDAQDIQTANAEYETGSFIRTLISYAVGITLLIVAGFGIYNILNMMIYEKMDTIAILKATGFSGIDVQMVFLMIAISIGLAGGFAGLLFGLGASYLIDQIPFTTASLPTITTYPVNYSSTLYITGAVFSVITTFMAGWFPSRKASRIDPVIIIRGK